VTDGCVLLCFDGSPEAEAAIRAAGALLAGREAIVLAVAIPAADELPLDPASDLVGRISGLYRDWNEIAIELAERHARSGCEIATSAGFAARPLTASGRPAATILRVADEIGAAAIVLGAGRHAALAGLLGSVSARVVQQARRPVLVIPARGPRP
jgi:nucleotide-binding universal stress UspA family protein